MIMNTLRINLLKKTEMPDIFTIDYEIWKSGDIKTEYISKQISIYDFFDFDIPVENIEIEPNAFEGLTIPEFRVPKGFMMPEHLFGSKNTVVEKLIISSDYEWPVYLGDKVLAERYDTEVYTWRIKSLEFEEGIKALPIFNVVMDLDEIVVPDHIQFGKSYPLLNVDIPYFSIPDGEKDLDNFSFLYVEWLSIPDSVKKVNYRADQEIKNIIFKGEIDSVDYSTHLGNVNVFTEQPEKFKHVSRSNIFDLNSFDTIAAFFSDFKMSEIQKIESLSYPFLTSELYKSENNTFDLEQLLKQHFYDNDSDISDESLSNVIKVKEHIEALNIIGDESMFRNDGNPSDESSMNIVGKTSMFKHGKNPTSVAEIMTVDSDSDIDPKEEKCKSNTEIISVFGINSH